MFKGTELISRPGFKLFTEEDRRTWLDSGFLLVKGLFSPTAVRKLREEAEISISPEDVQIKGDQHGNKTMLKMWNRPTDDIFGMFSRNERIVNNMEILLGEPVYLYSAKMILKNAKDGGAWEWHQDYGYWYNYGCLLPTMASCTVAVDRATQENGCIQLLRHTQKLGRIDHSRINEQTVADPERVEVCLSRYERVYAEMEPGDALFFDGNILHRSDSNSSPFDRWSFIASYNTVSNQPFLRIRDYGNYEPMVKVPASAILQRNGEG